MPPSISSRNRLAHVLAVGAQNADLARQRAIAKAVTETAQIGVSIDRWEDAEANKERSPAMRMRAQKMMPNSY